MDIFFYNILFYDYTKPPPTPDDVLPNNKDAKSENAVVLEGRLHILSFYLEDLLEGNLLKNAYQHKCT